METVEYWATFKTTLLHLSFDVLFQIKTLAYEEQKVFTQLWKSKVIETDR